MRKRWLMVLAVVGLLALLAIPATALAQGSDEETWGYYPAYRGLWDLSAQDRVAELLGLTPTELMTRLEGGATLGELAAASNVSTDTVVATILAPHKEMLDIKVKYGRMTAEQAQQALEALTIRVQALVQTTFAATSSFGPGVGAYCPMMGGGYQAGAAAGPSSNPRGWGRGMMGGRMMGGWRW